MTKKSRTCLFFICVFLFLSTAPSVILYSQGYRIDFERKRIVKTGAFYFKIVPKGTEIFIDGKLKKKTDFFFGSAFLENLLPRKYLVEIKKSKYQTWRKNLEIQEAWVTEAKNIVLVPEKLGFELLDKDVKNLFISPDERTVIFEKEIMINEQKKWSLKLYDIERGIKSHLIDEREISKEAVLFLDLIWSPDSNRIILTAEIETKVKYFLLDLSKSPVSLKALDFLEDIEEISFHPTDPQKLFFTKISEKLIKEQEENSLLLFEANIEKESKILVLDNLLAYKIAGENIFWISEDGFLQKSDLSGKSQKVSLEPIPVKETFLEIEVLNSKIFLKEGETLFFFNEESKKFKEIGSKIKSVKISPDSKKVCFQNDFEILVLFLEEELGQPKKEMETKLFLTRFSQKIGQVFWWTGHYLIFNVGTETKIIEIDDRDEIQIWNLANFENPEIYYNQKDKKLYILTQGNLFVSEKLF